jgi:membrane-associated phospholipid phosphatase
MLFSTIYLRYHYVIDIIAGLVFAVVVIIIAQVLYRKDSEKLYPKNNSP